ncbi:cytochrome C biogenesis protein CycH [Polaribacter glomeratus]|uniref:Cytochrome C biogenesis protein CycH n=1 Tax=Polaribacter glomeratus TaxID=102 RepID=A0A2S7WIH8_9FLAO|nr:cytochrome C biogenesis protein CycH [Polaribacter glomeratus]
MVKSKIDIFKSKDGIEVQVNLDKDTVWLSQLQMQDLFLKSKATISEHIRNIFKENELEENVVVRKFRTTTQHGAISGKTQSSLINLYNLDVIISVGYRVKSERGTQFRIWATNTLREHLIKGYSINEKRLEQLQKTIQLVQRTSKLTKDTEGLIDVLADYSSALDILDSFDHQTLTRDNVNNFVSYQIEYAEAKSAIESLKIKFGGSSLFGNEKDNSFKSSIATIDQTFDGKELYTSIEEKAANLLYFVVKNHSFTDGNKRIAAWLFVWYLNKNDFLYKDDNSKRIENNTLVALTLMIAESNPNEKEMMVNVIINLIN